MYARYFIVCKGLFKSLFISVVAAILVAAPLFLHAANQKAVPEKHTKTIKTIVVYGDSLSAAYGIAQNQGWVALLQQRLSKKSPHYKTVNASISGETTSGGLSRFADMLTSQKPNIILLELGGNDGLRGLNNSDIYNNLESMIKLAKAQKAQIVLLGMKIPPNYGLKYSKQFSENYALLAQKHNLTLVPFMLEGVAGKPQLIQADGLHPLAIAQPTILENVWPSLLKLL